MTTDFDSVIVSGIGAISAAGNNINANFANMSAGIRSPKSAPTIFECDFKRPVFECDSTVLDKNLLPNSRTLALTLKALHEALNDAQLTASELQNKTVGVCIGTTVACTLNDLHFYSEIRNNKRPDIHPLQRYIENNIAKYISAKYTLSGPVALIANACASGTNAIATASSWVQSRLCDIAIAGGADELNLIPYCGFNALQVVSDKPCLPFSPEREGLNLGEGAGIVILESYNSAEERGVKKEITLAASTGASDAFHLTGPHPEGEGLYNAIVSAMKKISISPDEIDYINAHGTATMENDKIEALVFNRISENIKNRYSSTKYYTGHTLGAAGAIEAAISVKGMREGHFPGLNGAPPIPYNGNAVLSTSMAFGGSCSTLIFTKNRAPHTPQKVEQKTTNAYIDVAGTGIIGPFGNGINEFKNALSKQPEDAAARYIPENTLKDPDFKRVRRRADKLSLAMLAVAKDAIRQSGISEQEIARTALITATGFGAHNTTFKFLDDIIEFGQSAPSPTLFSNSVHNAPSFYITHFLKIKGLSVTFTGLNQPFAEAFNYASFLVKSGEYKNVLLVAGDEISAPMLKMSQLWYESNKQHQPIWGEGAVAFLFTQNNTTSKIDTHSQFIEQKIKNIFGQTLINDAFQMALNIISDKT